MLRQRLYNLRKKLRRVLDDYRAFRLMDERPATPGEAAFAQKNAAFWDRQMPYKAEPEGYVLMEVHSVAYFTHYTASITRIAAAVKNAKVLALTVPNRNVYPGNVLRSYAPLEGIQISRWRFARFEWAAARQAKQVYQTLATPDDVLCLEIDGIPVGGLVYDEILREMGYATLSAVDERVLQTLQTFFLYRALAQYILARYPIQYAVFSHMIGCYPGVFARYLLKAGIPVLLCRSAAQPTLRKHEQLDQVWDHPLRPLAVHIDVAEQEARETVVAAGTAYLEQRFGQKIDDRDAGLAFQANKQTFADRDAFAQKHGLDPSRKNVFVMLHAFNDHPHFQGRESILFQDYYHWLLATLQGAKKNPSVNWIFKEHPAARFYQTQDLDFDALFGDTGEHIVFIDYQADFNARSLQFLADVVVTCLGTAGIEYSAVGIPCLLGGESAYSGYGFTVEPDTPAAYAERLRTIDTIAPLTRAQRERALVVLFVHLRMLKNDPFLFLPDPSHYHQKGVFKEININHGTGLDAFWNDAGAWLEGLDPEQAQAEIDGIARFIAHPTLLQYIDEAKFPYMKAVAEALQKEAREPVGSVA